MDKKNRTPTAVILVLITASLFSCAKQPPEPIKPQPGATLVGAIAMDRAKSAQIRLKVSADGQTIESVSLAFTELQCEGFSAGSSSTTTSTRAAITDGNFELKPSNIGEIRGQFTSPTAAKGTIHLAFFDGKAECGTWDWSAAGE